MKVLAELQKERPFWQRYLLIMAIDSLVIVVLAGIVYVLGGSNQISNLYFISSLVFFVIAVLPIFSDMSGNLKVAGKTLKGEDTEELAKTHASKSEQGARTTYLYGLAGITALLLSLLLV
jgi:hypothetical protein